MGDMADMALDGVADFEERRLDFRLGRMSHIQAYEEGIIDELGYEIGSGASLKTCRCCKESGLHWKRVADRWLLFNKKGIHKCKAVPLPKIAKVVLSAAEREYGIDEYDVS